MATAVVVAVFQVLGVVSSVHAVMSTRTSQGMARYGNVTRLTAQAIAP